jgi:hypothetical protein
MKRKYHTLSLAIRFIFCTTLFFTFPAHGQTTVQTTDQTYRIVSRSQNKITLEFNFDRPILAGKKDVAVSSIQSPTKFVTTTFMHGLYPVAGFAYPIQGKVSAVRIVSKQEEIITGVALPEPQAAGDSPKGLTIGQKKASPIKTLSLAQQQQASRPYPAQSIEFSFSGLMRGTPLSMIRVSPYIYNPQLQQVQYAKKLTVEVTLDESAAPATTFKVGLADANLLYQSPLNRSVQNSRLLRSSASKTTASLRVVKGGGVTQSVFGSPQAGTGDPGLTTIVPARFRVIINADGIYHLTYQWLQQYGVDNDFYTCNPKTIRLFNKGIEVPIFVSNENTGTFGQSDYIEFFAASNKIGLQDPLRPDLYNDPYTSENVYYLYWEQQLTSTNLGLRLVDTSVELNQNLPASQNLANKSFLSTQHFEVDAIKDNLTQVDTTKLSEARDHFFWDGILVGQQTTYPVLLPSPSSVPGESGNVHIRVAMHGLTFKIPDTTNSVLVSRFYPSTSYMHNAVITLGNGNSNKLVATASWGKNGKVVNGRVVVDSSSNFGQSLAIADNTVGYSSLNGSLAADGQDQVQILNSPLNANDQDPREFYLNWIDITYPRNYEAYNNQLSFTAPSGTTPNQNYQFTIKGFTQPNISLYKKNVGRLTNFTVSAYQPLSGDGTLYQASFQDIVGDPTATTYIALPANTYQTPVRLEKIFEDPNQLRSLNNTYNFIIITSTALMSQQDLANTNSEVNQYKSYRQSKLADSQFEPSGRSGVLLVSVQSIYDAFSYGIKNPWAIRNFLDYAYHAWQQAPTYVLLLGDANNLYKTPLDIVPTMMFQSQAYGRTASDTWYAMLDGLDANGNPDLLPDLQIARVPAASRADILNFLNKLKSYESYSTFQNQWHNSILYVAGEDGVNTSTGLQDIRFITQEDDIITNEISKDYIVNRINTGQGRNIVSGNPPDPYAVGTGGGTILQRYLNSGQLVVTFAGHGASGVWDDGGVLTLDAVDQLANPNALPFLVSMTCFCGAFDDPSQINLNEKIVIKQNVGAIGAIGSAGKGWEYNDGYMMNEIFRFIFNDQYSGLAIGDLLTRAKISYYQLYDNTSSYSPHTLTATMINQYNVIGDPATRLAKPKYKLANLDATTHVVAAGDSLRVTGSTTAIATGSLVYTFSDDKNDPLISGIRIPTGASALITNGNFAFSAKIDTSGFNPRSFNQQLLGGNLKVYAQGSGTDAAGSIPFNLSAPLAVSVTHDTIVYTPTSQPVNLTARIDARTPIDSVRARIQVFQAGNGTTSVLRLDTVGRMTLKTGSTNLYQLPSPIAAPYITKGAKIVYTVMGYSGNYSPATFKDSVSVGVLPDVAAYPKAKLGLLQGFDNPSINFAVVGDSIVMQAKIYNWASVQIGRVRVRFYNNSVTNGKNSGTQVTLPVLNANPTILGETLLNNVQGDTLVSVKVPSSLALTQTYQLAVSTTIDTTTGNMDADNTNNLSNQVARTFALSRVTSQAQRIGLGVYASLAVGANAFNQTSGYLNLAQDSTLSKTSQPDNYFVRLRGADTSIAYQVAFTDTSFKFNSAIATPLVLMVRYDTSASKGIIGRDPTKPTRDRTKIAPYYYSSNFGRWYKLDAVPRTDDSIAIPIASSGLYAVMYYGDVTPPKAKLTIEGQAYTVGGVIPRRARIDATVQDENGVLVDYNHITATLDGVAIPSSKLVLPSASTNANVVGIIYDDTFSAGPHTISFAFTDANLNKSQPNIIQVNASDDFGLTIKGNYPNPFTDKTYIVFNISNVDRVDQVELKIYSVDGRVINSVNTQNGSTGSLFLSQPTDFQSTGPHIITWNGQDSQGNQVANGVYYAKIKITYQGKTVEKILKTARLK